MRDCQEAQRPSQAETAAVVAWQLSVKHPVALLSLLDIQSSEQLAIILKRVLESGTFVEGYHKPSTENP